MQVVFLAGGSVAPAPPFPPASVTRRTHFSIQVQLQFTVVQNHGELRAAGMEIEPARLAVVHEPRHVLLAGVAIAGNVPRGASQELEGTFGVERVDD